GDQVPAGDEGDGEQLEPGHLLDLGEGPGDVDPGGQEGEDGRGQQQRPQQLAPRGALGAHTRVASDVRLARSAPTRAERAASSSARSRSSSALPEAAWAWSG